MWGTAVWMSGDVAVGSTSWGTEETAPDLYLEELLWRSRSEAKRRDELNKRKHRKERIEDKI